jgi:hypothetical protein
MPKATTKNVSKSETSGKKSAASTKETKKAPAKEASEKKAPRRNLNQAVAYIYGGSLIKASHVYVFAVPDKDVVAYAQENLSQYFGGKVSGRSVKCEDAEDIFNKVLEQADEKGFRVEPDCPILKCSVNNAAQLLKDVADCTTANSFTLDKDRVKASKKDSSKKEKPSVKKGKKGKKDESAESDAEESDNADDADDADEVEEDEENADENEDEDADNAEDADEAGSDEEEEEKPAAKKSTPKKGEAKPTKSAAKGKDNDKSKAPKKGK